MKFSNHLLLLLVLVLSMFPSNSYSYSYDKSWYENPIRDHYYEINNKEQYEGLIQLINVDLVSFKNDTISITNNLSLANLESLNQFDGVLLGNSHTISDLTSPLIKTIENTGVVDAFEFDTSCSVSGGDKAGMVCGECNGIIKNCVNRGTITLSSSKYPYVGGLCAELEGGKIYGSINYGKISASVSGDNVLRVGGVCGVIRNAALIGCCNHGEISATAYQYALVGGITGDCQGSLIENCKNKGKVVSVLSGTANLTSTKVIQYTGGIAGQAQFNSILNKCSNFGAVQNNTQYVAGIAGHAGRSSIVNCENHGNITSIEDHFYSGVSGICSDFNAISLDEDKYFFNCINTGTISSKTKNDIATAAGICYDIKYAKVGNLLSLGSVVASAVGTNSREFNIPQYETSGCEILSDVSNIEEMNAFVKTYSGPFSLVSWRVDEEERVLLNNDFACYIEPHAGLALVYCISDSEMNYEIRYKERGTEAEMVQTFSQTIVLEALKPSTIYDYVITNSSLSVEGTFMTMPIEMQLMIDELKYTSAQLNLEVQAKGVEINEYGVKYRLTEDNQWLYTRSGSNKLKLDSLRDNAVYDIKPYIKYFDTEYEGEYQNFQTPELIPSTELLETTSSTLIFQTINKDELCQFKYGICYDDKEFNPDSTGLILVDSLPYYQNHNLYAFVEKYDSKVLYELGTFDMISFATETPLQISPRAAMVRVLGDAGYYNVTSSKKEPYDEISIEYRCVYASDTVTSCDVIPIKSDDYHEYCVTLPFERAGMYQYRIKATAKYYYSGNKEGYRYGDWKLIDSNAPTDVVVVPLFTNLKNVQDENAKANTISCANVVGEENVLEQGIEYKITGASDYIKIPLTSNKGVLSRTFTSLIPNMTYVGRFYNTTASTIYYSSEFLFDSKGTFSISNNSDSVTQPDFKEKLYLSIITPDLGEIIQEAEYLQSISLEIVPPPGWNINTVLLDGENITEQIEDNKVLIDPLTTNARLIISYDNSITDIPDGATSGIRVYAQGLSIYVQNLVSNSEIVVYDVLGRLIYQGTDTMINVDKEGVYLVVTEGVTYKVFVK